MADANMDVQPEELEMAAPIRKKLDLDDSNEPDIAETSRPQKSKKAKVTKKGGKKKRRAEEAEVETVGEDISERGDEDGIKEKSGGKKKKGKKKEKKREASVSNPAPEDSVQEIVEGPPAQVKDSTQETIIEIRDNNGTEDSNLQEIISDGSPKKDLETATASSEQNNNTNGGEAGDEKKDEKKGSDGEETSETIVEKQAESEGKEQTENVVERKISKKEDSAIRRRATLSELGTSVDESTGQTVGGPEVLDAVREESEEKKSEPVKDEGSEGENLQASPAAEDSTQEADKIETVSNEGDNLVQDADKPESVAIEIPAVDGTEQTATEVAVAITEETTTETMSIVVEKAHKVDGEKSEVVEVTETAVTVDTMPAEDDGKTEAVETEEIKPQSEPDIAPNVFLEYEVDDELPWAMYRSVDSIGKKPPVDEDEEWPESEEEEDVSPPPNDDLPDLDELMGTLDSGETQLETSAPPPPLFEPEEQREKQRQVHELKVGLADEPIDAYVDEFEKRMEDEVLMIGNISLEEVQEEERRLRDEHIAFQQQQNKVQRIRHEEIIQREEHAKKHVMSVLKEKSKRIQRKEEHMMQQDRLVQNRIHRAFRRAEHQLLKALIARKGEVKTMYGDLVMADGQYGGSKGRRWKVDWNRTPQPIQIKLKCLRGVKDKLPSGRYVLMVSLYDRLGGHVLKWSNLKGQQWGGATLPLQHDGEFYNIEIKIDQSVFTVCPAKPDVRPGMVLVFELFILRGSVTPTDRVVGWGCFPICDGEFNIVEGRYKSPFLRGDMDPGIDKHERIEELMAEDLENWLCNLYFEIVKLPRYMAGQKEYEVELQFTSGLISYPSRTNIDEEFIDGEAPIYGSRSDLKSAVSMEQRRSSKISTASSFFGSAMGLGLETATEEKEQPPGSSLNLKVEVSDMGKRRDSLAVPEMAKQQRRRSSATTVTLPPRPLTVHMSRKVMEYPDPSSASEGSGTDYSDDEVLMLRKNGDFKPVKGQPGMYYKKHKNNPADVYAKKMYTMIPKTPILTKRGKKKKKLTHLEELDQHTFSVKQPFSNKGHILHRGTEKMQYVSRQLLAELGLSQWRSREFWAMMLMIVLTWWIRLYSHYGGQWIFLNALYIPINKFEFLPYSVNLNYQNTLLHTREEIALIIIGPFTNIIIFCTLIIFSWFIQRLFNLFPNIISRFIMAFGINTLLDPIWIFVVDMALLRYLPLGADVPIADAAKLYYHFDRFEKNGAIGIAITILMYVVTIFTASTVLYMYFLRIHNNGRLMDVYHRLHAKEESFFIAYDLEISNEELNFICKKAEQWRGEEGERRKVAVYDYIWEEEQIDEAGMGDPSNKKEGHREITTHVSVHTLHLDGLRELYRHFLRLPDGAIVEVFGEMGVAGMDESIKQALVKGTSYQGVDNTASRSSLRSRTRAGSAASVGSFRRPSVLLEVPKTAGGPRSPSPV